MENGQLKIETLIRRVGSRCGALLLAGLPVFAQGPAEPVARPDAVRTAGAIAGGLRWLAERQNTNGVEAGSWRVNIGNYRPAVASLAGLAFLANGHLPGDDGPYGTNVANALKYVMGTMAPDGYMGQGDRSGMYIHAISSLFALSCLGMQADETLEPELAEWCRRSLEVTLRAQQISKTVVARGGWRYDPYTAESDVSVTCWQLLVLHTARQAGYDVDPSVFYTAQPYLNRAWVAVKPEEGQDQAGPAGGYRYRPGFTREPSRSTTALVVFIQSLFGAANEHRTRGALTYLRRYPLTWDGSQYGGFFYFSAFYMVQGMFQVGGEEWESFGPRMAALLLDHQSGDGSWPYPPGNELPALTQGTGPAYPVAMAVLMLSLDKQFLPMYQRQSSLYDSGASAAPPLAEAAEEDAATAMTEDDDTEPLLLTPESESDLPPATTDAWDGEFDQGEAWDPAPEDDIDRTIGRPLF